MVSSDRKSLTERDVCPYYKNNLSRWFEVKGRISRDILNFTQEAPLKIDPNFKSSNLSLSNRNQFSASMRGRWCFIFASYVKILPLGQNMSNIIHFECKTGKCVGRNSKYLLRFYLWHQILLADYSHDNDEHFAKLNFFYRSSPSKVTAPQRCILSTFEWGILRSRWAIPERYGCCHGQSRMPAFGGKRKWSSRTD